MAVAARCKPSRLAEEDRLDVFAPIAVGAARRIAPRSEPRLRSERNGPLPDVYPRGQRDKWTERFEDLYRSFVHYFSVRGFNLAKPEFPLVGFVCKNRSDFDRLAATQHGASSGIVGYYSNISNRITLYDMGGRANSANRPKTPRC